MKDAKLEPFDNFEWLRPAPELGSWMDAMGPGDAAPARWLPCHVGLYDEGQDRAEFNAAAAIEWSSHCQLRYEPLVESPALFRQFADLNDNENAMAAFSSRYGRLGRGEPVLPATVRELPRGLVVESAEHIDVWRDHITLMKTGVALWDALRAKDARAIRQLMHYSKANGRATFELAIPCRRVDVGEACEDGARLFFWMQTPLDRPVNEEDAAVGALRGLVSIVLSASSAPALDVRPGSRRLDLVVRPYDLAGALWLQFARAVAGNRTYQACECCGKWFEKSPAVSRSDREYCSGSCRSKAWRDRKHGRSRPEGGSRADS